MRLNLSAAILCGLMLAGCDGSPWLALLNSPKTTTSGSEQVVLGEYRSLEECRGAAIGALHSKGWQEGGSYFCGYKCRKEKDVHVCSSGGR